MIAILRRERRGDGPQRRLVVVYITVSRCPVMIAIVIAGASASASASPGRDGERAAVGIAPVIEQEILVAEF